MKRQRLSGKDVKALNEALALRYGQPELLNKADNVELVEDKLLIVNGETFFFYVEDVPIPTLRLVLKNNFLKKVVIDMPAVRFIADGADVMRPGIKATDLFGKDEIVVVVDEKYSKPLAIGKALFSSEEIKAMEKGKAVKNLHHVGDEIWGGAAK